MLHSICQQIWKTQQWPQAWKRSIFIAIPKKGNAKECASSVQFSRLVVSDSLQPHELQHARPPCPSPTPRVHPNPSPSSQWCHPTISSSLVPFSSCPQSFPASGSFPKSRLFASGGQSIGAETSVLILLMNIQGWFPLVLTDLISLLSKRPSRVFSSTTVRKYQLSHVQPSLWSKSHIRIWLLEKS